MNSNDVFTVRDPWLLPILEEILPADAIASIERTVSESYWEAAVATGSISDERLLGIVSRRARTTVAEVFTDFCFAAGVTTCSVNCV